jgi:hypothetical protein
VNWATFKANVFKSPKTTITGLCGAGIAITLAWMSLPPKASVPVTIIAILRALVDFTKQDAGVTSAIVPGSPTPQLVPSHEVPDDPNATPTSKG